MTKELTKGNPFKLILFFAIPIFLGNVIQQLYNIVDTLIVGHTVSTNVMTGIGCTGSITFFILGFANGLTSGFGIKLSQCFGSGDTEALKKNIATSLILCAAMSVILMSIAIPLTSPLLKMMKTGKEYFDYAYWYLMIIFAGIAATVLYNMVAYALRAIGDSKAPLMFLAVSAVLNIGFDLLFILVFKLNYTGAALATVLSSLISGIASLIYMFWRYPFIRLKAKDFKTSSKLIFGQISIGLPMALQFSITAIGCIIQQTALNGLNDTNKGCVTAYTAAAKIHNFVDQTLFAIGTTVANYVGQNTGAEKYGRIKDCVFVSMIYVVICWIAGILLCLLLGNSMMGLFIDKSTGDGLLYYDKIISYGKRFLMCQSSMYIMLGAILVYRSALQGMGRSSIAVIAGIMELIGRSVASFVLVKLLGYTGICFSDPIAWIAANLYLIPTYYVIISKKKGSREYTLLSLFKKHKITTEVKDNND